MRLWRALLGRAAVLVVRRTLLLALTVSVGVVVPQLLDVPGVVDLAVPAPAAEEPGTHATTPAQLRQRAVDEAVGLLAARHGCTRAGLPAGVVPVHAIVLREDGPVLTSFEEGWAVHEGRLPGQLMMVCRR